MLEKIKRIMELAYLINPTKTQQEITGNKPTIFVDFSGHVNWVHTYVYPNGYGNGASSDIDYRIDLEDEDALQQLNDCIKYLETLYEKWGKNAKPQF